jgi:hypothetical protein
MLPLVRGDDRVFRRGVQHLDDEVHRPCGVEKLETKQGGPPGNPVWSSDVKSEG